MLHSVVLLLVSALCLANASTYYVLANEAVSRLDCPWPIVDECDYFDAYAYMSTTYFRSGSTFIFMAGNHTLNFELELSGVSNIFMRGQENEPNRNIVCKLAHSINLLNTFNIRLSGMTFLLHSYEHDRQSALWMEFSYVFITSVIFQGSGRTDDLYIARAIYSSSSNITITGSYFTGNAMFDQGGAIQVTGRSNLTVINSTFSDNLAKDSGGAISIVGESMHPSAVISGSTFTHNSAYENGGAIFCDTCTLVLHGSNNFTQNRCKVVPQTHYYFPKGGAVYTLSGIFILTGVAHFERNQAQEGGAVYIISMVVHVQVESLTMENNFDGAFAISRCKNASFHGNMTFRNNRGYLLSALYVLTSSATLTGRLYFFNNTGRVGGAVRIEEESSVSLIGNTHFDSNSAVLGGAVYCANSALKFHIRPVLSSNSAATEGGALYASEADLILYEGAVVMIRNNSAENGGGLYLRGGTTLKFHLDSKLVISNNDAYDYGGGIFYEDSVSSTQCSISVDDSDTISAEILPYCFLRYGPITPPHLLITNVTYNTAGKDGSNLFGGLLDKCRLLLADGSSGFPAYRIVVQTRNTSVTDSVNPVSSKPYKLCFCDNNARHDCTGARNE